MSANVPRNNPSPASKPDLDWSQIRETVLMLNVAVAQIRNAMSDGDDSINALSSVFTKIFASEKTIGIAATKLAESSEKQVILQNHAQTTTLIEQTIINFQFYDKLVQRLAHVTQSLAGLGEIVSDMQRIYNPCEWRHLQEKIKSRYSIDEDQQMFELVLQGKSVEEALEQSKNTTDSVKQNQDSIELF